jgi:hypothetical protein
MQNFEQNASTSDRLMMAFGSAAGGALALLMIRAASPVQAMIVCSLVTACLTVVCTQLNKPLLWWAMVGAIVGINIGTSWVVSEVVRVRDVQTLFDFRFRLLLVGVQGLAGFIAGMLLGRKIHNPHVPPLKTFLSRLGALTVGTYATIVTIEYVVHGLEAARSFSSRLSTSTTIWITAFVAPGVIGYLLTERRTRKKQR